MGSGVSPEDAIGVEPRYGKFRPQGAVTIVIAGFQKIKINLDRRSISNEKATLQLLVADFGRISALPLIDLILGSDKRESVTKCNLARNSCPVSGSKLEILVPFALYQGNLCQTVYSSSLIIRLTLPKRSFCLR